MFFDIQVNGAFGVDFNDDNLTLTAFQHVCEKLHEQNVSHFFPTIITASKDEMLRRITKIAGFLEDDESLKKIVRGLHIEGPYISEKEGFRGTHPVEHVRPAILEETKELYQAANGLLRMMTLAPEQDPTGGCTKFLSENHVRVFGGHSDASIEQLKRSIDSGLIGYTHLGNGCSLSMHRHENILHRILALRNQLYVSLILDGIHLPLWLAKSWIEHFGEDRVIVTSDAMSAAGMPPGEYWIGGQPIEVDSERRTRHREHHYLAGSASTMLDMERKVREWGAAEITIQNLFSKNATRLFETEH